MRRRSRVRPAAHGAGRRRRTMPDVSSARAERLVNLVLCLLSTRQFLSAERIRTIVPGYADAPNDEAFFRMFERDKNELRELGVPLESGQARDRHRRRLPHRPPGLRARRDRPGVRRGGRRGAGRAAVGVTGAGRARARRAGEAPRGGCRGRRGPGPGAAAGARWRARVRAAAGRRAGRARGHVRLPPRRPGGRGRAAHRRAVGRGVLAGPLVRGRARPRSGRAALVPGVAHRRAGAGDRPVGCGGGAHRRRPARHGARRGRARRRWSAPRGCGWPRAGRTGCAASAARSGRAGTRVRPGEEIELELRSLETVARWLAGHGADIAVLDPPSLSDRVRANWEAAAAAHADAPPAASA